VVFMAGQQPEQVARCAFSSPRSAVAPHDSCYLLRSSFCAEVGLLGSGCVSSVLPTLQRRLEESDVAAGQAQAVAAEGVTTATTSSSDGGGSGGSSSGSSSSSSSSGGSGSGSSSDSGRGVPVPSPVEMELDVEPEQGRHSLRFGLDTAAYAAVASDFMALHGLSHAFQVQGAGGVSVRCACWSCCVCCVCWMCWACCCCVLLRVVTVILACVLG
jgi:hypothetical protein